MQINDDPKTQDLCHRVNAFFENEMTANGMNGDQLVYSLCNQIAYYSCSAPNPNQCINKAVSWIKSETEDKRKRFLQYQKEQRKQNGGGLIIL